MSDKNVNSKELDERAHLMHIDLAGLYTKLVKVHLELNSAYFSEEGITPETMQKIKEMYDNLKKGMDKFTDKWGKESKLRLSLFCYRDSKEIDREIVYFNAKPDSSSCVMEPQVDIG